MVYAKSEKIEGAIIDSNGFREKRKMPADRINGDLRAKKENLALSEVCE